MPESFGDSSMRAKRRRPPEGGIISSVATINGLISQLSLDIGEIAMLTSRENLRKLKKRAESID